MTRIYFEKAGFRSFHKAFAEKRKLKTKFNLHCKIIENADGTAYLSITSVNEKSQRLLRELGFNEIKVEAI